MAHYTTKSIDEEDMSWIFETTNHVVKLLKRQHLFITRGTRHTRHFSFPKAVLVTIHRKLLQAGYSISEEEMKVCPFIFDVKGMQMPNGDWIKFDPDD